MSRKTEDPVIASCGDSVLRRSDLRLLEPPNWFNDRIIGYFFEYIHENIFDGTHKISFISPEVSQFLKMTNNEEISIFLEPLDLCEKEMIVFAVNNASDPNSPGGSHWSLLLYSRQGPYFYHMDSSHGMNVEHARTIAGKLHHFLKKKRAEFGSLQSRNDYKFSFSEVPVMNQTNGYDCGLHVLCHAEYSLRHFMVFGSSKGLKPLEPSMIRKKRADLKKLVEGNAKNSH